MVHSAYSMDLDKCAVTSVHHDSIAQSGSTASETLRALPVLSSRLTDPGTADLFIDSRLLSFPECYTVVTTQDVAFSDFLLSLSSMYLRFLQMSFPDLIAGFILAFDNVPVSVCTSCNLMILFKFKVTIHYFLFFDVQIFANVVRMFPLKPVKFIISLQHIIIYYK